MTICYDNYVRMRRFNVKILNSIITYKKEPKTFDCEELGQFVIDTM